MWRIRNKVLIVVVSLSLLGSLFVESASAYKLDSDGHRFFKCSTCNTSYPTYSWGDYMGGTSVIKTGWQNAISDWNNAQSKVEFVYSSGSSSKLHSMHNLDKSLFGRMQYNYDAFKFVTKFNGYINAYANYNDQKISDTNVARSTGVHELGHAMGIDHVSGTSIMNTSRNRKTLYKPQTDDINGVNARYK